MAWLLDSAVYIDRLRAGEAVWQRVLPMVRAGELYGCGIVRAEVLRGIKNLRLKKVMEELFDITPEIPTDARMWRRHHRSGLAIGQGKGGIPSTHGHCNRLVRDSRRSHPGFAGPAFRRIPGLRWQTDLPSM